MRTRSAASKLRCPRSVLTLSEHRQGGSSESEASTEAFVRDRLTILSYSALGVYAYYLYGLGPILTFLHDELGISNTLTTLHSSLWAAGTIVTGLLFDRISRRIGRYRLFWLSAAGTAAGALLFSVSHTVGLTLLSAALLGNVGTLLQTGTSVVLSDRHGKRRDRAFVEANIGASAAAVLAPLFFGFLHGTPVGWRIGLLLPVLALGTLYIVFRKDGLPVSQPPSGGRSEQGRLPAEYWLLALLVAAVVAVEFCVVFYGAELLKAGVGMSTADAATTMSVFYVGILLGRILGSGLTRQPGRAVALLLGTLTLTTIGFLGFWLSGHVTVATAGLFITGLGVANLYPLTLALAVAAAPGQTDKANARAQLLIGVAVVIAPLALGVLSDAVGVPSAFAVELALIVLALMFLLAERIWARRARTQASS